jgi:hypothetical protein
MANIALDAGKIVLKDGKASCTCCGGGIICPEITQNYNVISEEMYNALQAGGNYVANGTMFEYNYYNPSGSNCNMSASDSGIIPTGNCGANIFVSQEKCSGTSEAYIAFTYIVSKVGQEYRFTYYGGTNTGISGGAYCPSPIGGGACYSIGYNIGWIYDNIPQGPIFCPIAGGGITLTTSAGTFGPFGIYTFCGFPSSGSLNITITPFP